MQDKNNNKKPFALAQHEFFLDESCEDEGQHTSQSVFFLSHVDLQISDTKSCHMS